MSCNHFSDKAMQSDYLKPHCPIFSLCRGIKEWDPEQL